MNMDNHIDRYLLGKVDEELYIEKQVLNLII
jgi:hypothetical protein